MVSSFKGNKTGFTICGGYSLIVMENSVSEISSITKPLVLVAEKLFLRIADGILIGAQKFSPRIPRRKLLVLTLYKISD